MADAMTLDAPVGVAAPAAGTTGQPQGAPQAPSLSKLYDQLPEATRKEIKAERFAPLAKLDNLVAEINRLDGEVGNGIRVPGKDATKEQWAKYRKDLGIPESPEGYALTIPKLPNGLTYNDTLEKWFRKQLFDAGVPQSHAEKMFNDWNASQIAAYDANQKAQEQQRIAFAKQTQETLQAEWKDDYGRNVETMKAAIARFGGPEVLQVLQNARLPNGVTLDNHPAFAKAFYEIGKRMEADTMVAGETGAGATRTDEGRPGLPLDPVTGRPMPMMYPDMEKDPRFRVKAE